MNVRLAALVFGSLAAFSLLAGSAHAASYGDFLGSTVVFENVVDQNDLYGAPTVSADSLDFDPNTFEAGCPTHGCVSELVVDTLTLTIQANSGQFIDDILYQRGGQLQPLDIPRR